MSHRREDQNLLDMLRDMNARIDKLQKGDKGVRQNDIRLGDMVVTTDASNNQLCITNLITGEVVCMGGGRQQNFSFSGEVLMSDDDFANVSPSFAPERDIHVSEVRAFTALPFDGEIEMTVVFPYLSVPLVLSGSDYNPPHIMVPLDKVVKAGQQVYVRLDAVTGAEVAPTNLTVRLVFD